MPAPRLYVDRLLASGNVVELPDEAAHHARVLRLAPGAQVVLFDGRGGEWFASVQRIERSAVRVLVGEHRAVDRESPWRVASAFAMPANDRMDALVEKLTELGVEVVQPLVCERSVLRLSGERAVRKVAHWQGVALAACEQCGRTRLPLVEPVRSFAEWIEGPLVRATSQRWVLSIPEPGEAGLRSTRSSQAAERHWLQSPQGARPLRAVASAVVPGAVAALSGPEGGLSTSETAAAYRLGFEPVSLGPRVLRADTAPLALLAALEHLGEVPTPD